MISLSLSLAVVVGIRADSDASKTSEDAADDEDGADSSRVTSSGDVRVPLVLPFVGVLAAECVEEGVDEGIEI